MKSEKLEKELQQHEETMSSLIEQMDTLYCEIQDAMPAVAVSWMKMQVESRIMDNPDTVQSLGIEKLKDLKSKLNSLIERLPEIVALEFQDRNRWPHHIEPRDEFPPTYQRNEPHLYSTFRNVISNLGGLLNEFGLLSDPGGYSTSWQSLGNDRFRYAINPGPIYLSKEKEEEYNILFKNYNSLIREIKDTRKSLSEARAKELWEQA